MGGSNVNNTALSILGGGETFVDILSTFGASVSVDCDRVFQLAFMASRFAFL
jgi:hypothetical protein